MLPTLNLASEPLNTLKHSDSLTSPQVCRQVRAEFRLIYMSEPDNAVWLRDTGLISYLDVFLPGWNIADKEKGDFAAHITITSIDVWLERGLSLVLLIRFLSEARNVHINLIDVDWAVDDEEIHIEAMFDCRTCWAERLGDVVEEKSASTLGPGVPSFMWYLARTSQHLRSWLRRRLLSFLLR